ncbi:MAG: NAD-dependent epimerase/dehydratase family protein [Clostridia bacterium]|nr:NAD-dependent epimerase/dehydratase family protein [Clostridia bacterium]
MAMKIAVTGAAGFVGKNLVAVLKAVRDQKIDVHGELKIDGIFEITRDTPEAFFDEAMEKADFVFHLAGVNREENGKKLSENIAVTEQLIAGLERHQNACPVMVASSIQAAQTDRFADSAYGKIKAETEALIREHSRRTGAKNLIYRFPNLFGKWCKPFCHSAVATFCCQAANGLPFTVHDKSVELELLYIDDVVKELLLALSGKEHRCNYQGETVLFCENGAFCASPNSTRATIETVIHLLEQFVKQAETLMMPNIFGDRFKKHLYSTYLSYLPAEKIRVPLEMHKDERGSFTELMRTVDCGQISVNVQKPGVVKGQHWHFSKWKKYTVVSGRGLVEQRKIGTDEILRFEVSSERLETIYIPPGYTNSITNLSETEDLVTVIWVNELYDPQAPDTIAERVEI